MTSAITEPAEPRVFTDARRLLAEATVHRREVNDVWNSIRAERSFSAYIETRDDLVRELWCSFDMPSALRHAANQAVTAFVRTIKAAMDACVLATAIANCGEDLVDPSGHYMPLCDNARHFDDLQFNGQLMGLRPDQISALRLLQPFHLVGNESPIKEMAHLAAALGAIADGRTLFTAWVSQAQPEPYLPEGVVVTNTTVDNAGTLVVPKRLAAFKIRPDKSDVKFAGNPNVSFDPVINADPWPVDPDDNLSARSNTLIVITKHLIEGLERSVNMPFRSDTLTELDALARAEQAPTWLPVQFDNLNDEAEVRSAIAESDQGLATYMLAESQLTYLKLVDDSVFGRTIPAASTPGAAESYGIAVEEATRHAAGFWGLPDFVLKPAVVAKGSGIREIGDGTIFCGDKGIALQVKARDVDSDNAERAAKWLLKNARDGLRQARGTIRTTLGNPDVTLTNLRGRAVTFAATKVSWVPVVVLDHPNPPREVFPEADPKGPSVVVLRRDWEFLWDQLRSANAIVDYVHRVASEDPIELGSETHRYFDLANRDQLAPPNPLPDWIVSGEANSQHFPLLPHDPAASPDEFGHRIFQQVLEDLADTDFTGDEVERIHILSLIDRIPVGSRAALGRTLLERLIRCAKAPLGSFRFEHRIVFIDNGGLHLTFTTMTRLTGYHREIYQNWLLHRRQGFLTQSGALGPAWPWTVGVLLTPRLDGLRPWDTTVIATSGPPYFDGEEYAHLGEVFAPDPGSA